MWIVNNFSICKQIKLQSHVFRPARGHSCWPSQVRFLAPNNSNVKKYVNKYWAAFRPKDPTDLDFEVSFPCIYHNETVIDNWSIFAWAINLVFVFIFLDWQGFPPGQEFLVADLLVGEERHLVGTPTSQEVVRGWQGILFIYWNVYWNAIIKLCWIFLTLIFFLLADSASQMDNWCPFMSLCRRTASRCNFHCCLSWCPEDEKRTMLR